MVVFGSKHSMDKLLVLFYDVDKFRMKATIFEMRFFELRGEFQEQAAHSIFFVWDTVNGDIRPSQFNYRYETDLLNFSIQVKNLR